MRPSKLDFLVRLPQVLNKLSELIEEREKESQSFL
jgi:hypothetical protein